MKHADLSLLPEYLKSRRWFAGKAWPIKRTTVIDSATLGAFWTVLTPSMIIGAASVTTPAATPPTTPPITPPSTPPAGSAGTGGRRRAFGGGGAGTC